MALDLSQNTLTLAELYEIEMVNGLLLYVTNHDRQIEYDGKTYLAVPVQRGPISYHSNLQVDKVELTIGIVGITVGEKVVTAPQMVKRDYLRNAHVRVLLVDFVALDDDKLLFEGWVTGGVSLNAGSLTLSVGSILDRLSQKVPKIIYSEFCQHRLFSVSENEWEPQCGLVKAEWAVTGTTAAESDEITIYSTEFAFSAHTENYWTCGELQITSGDNSGLSRTIIEHNDGYVILLTPFPEAITGGETFTVYPGCDRSGETCATKFDNYVHFFGFESIPKPEMLY